MKDPPTSRARPGARGRPGAVAAAAAGVTGAVQVERRAEPGPNGATGNHTIQVNVAPA